jgi:sulfatase modifying factor 1
MKLKIFHLSIPFLFGLLLIFSSCKKNEKPSATNPGETSTTTGLAYSDEDCFPSYDFEEPEGPNLAFISGGCAMLGNFGDDLVSFEENIPHRRVTIESFYMDETEIANIHWLEYLFYVQRDSTPEYYESALPDTTVWYASLAFNDPYVEHYLRYPGFRFFPVVGVNWIQANDFCLWRTSMVNNNRSQNPPKEPKNKKSSTDSTGSVENTYKVTLPNYRLPTEAEWEYAATAIVYQNELNKNHPRMYPWDGHALRNPNKKQMGTFLANFKRGRGDYAGIAGKLNDGAMVTTYIYEYPPNDFGLYNMAGNVNEWVFDVYKPLSFQQLSDLNPVETDNGFIDQEVGYDKSGFQLLATNHDRVYKGGSWKDVAYWLSPGTRRYLAEDSSTATLGFRCAMDALGGPKKEKEKTKQEDEFKTTATKVNSSKKSKKKKKTEEVENNTNVEQPKNTEEISNPESTPTLQKQE